MSVLKTLLGEVRAKQTPFQPTSEIPESDVQAAIQSVYDGALIDEFTQSGTGAVTRTFLAKVRETCVTPQDFGAVGDNSTDDSAAFQAAFTAGSNVYVPPGTYYLGNTALTVTNEAFRLFGAGLGVSVLRWNGSSGGISVSQSSAAYHTEISDISLHQSGAGVGTAIAYDGSGQKSAGTIQNRNSPRLLLENISLRGTTDVATDGWDVAVSCNNVMHAVVRGVHIAGKHATYPTLTSTRGLYFYGDGDPAEINVSDCWATAVGVAVEATQPEGVFIDHCNFVAVTTGVKASHTTSQPQVCVTNCHIAAFAYCIDASNVAQGQYINNLLYSRSDATSSVTHIRLASGCIKSHVSFNTFVKTSSNVDTSIDIGSGASACSNNVIRGNIFGTADTAISLGAQATSTHIVGNRYPDGGITQLSDSGTDTYRAFDNFNGTAAAPSWTWDSDPDTGMYRVAANSLGFSTGGTLRASFADSFVFALGATASTETAAIEIGTGRSDNGNSYIDLVGDATYADFGLRLIRNAGANNGATFDHRGTGALRIRSVDAGSVVLATNNTDRVTVSSSGDLSPSSSDGSALGTSSLMWSDLFLASGSVVNFNNGDVTLTHSANALTIGGATAIAFGAGTTVRPGGDDGATLGASGTAWSDLFLASGAVVNFNAGDVTLTHASNMLTMAGGVLNVGGAPDSWGVTGITGYTASASGSAAVVETSFNHIFVNADTIDATAGGGSKANAFKVRHEFGDSNTKGGRHAIYGFITQEAATSATNTDRNYVGVVGHAYISTGDGGGSGTEKGSYFGANFVGDLLSGATNTTNVTSCEFNTKVFTGASTLYRSGIQIAGGGDVRGSNHDCAIGIGNLGAATTTWLTGIKFHDGHGDNPLGADSTVIQVTAPTTIDRLIDCTGISFTTAILQTQDVTWTDTALQLKGSSQSIELGSLTGSNTPVIDFHSSGNNVDYDARIIASGGSGSVGQGALKVAAAGGLSPVASDGVALGTSSLMWSDLFLASGSVVNFDAGDVTITHSSNALTVSGASVIAFAAGTVVRPGADDGATLGAAATAWSDLFLASGAVIGFANGDVTITHSSGLLTISDPISLGTSNALTAGSIELGHASDTTVSRGAAGSLLVEGNPVGIVIAHSAAGFASTNTTSEEALATVAIPANALGANGFLLIEMSWTATNNANVKTCRVRFGASGAGTGGTAFPAISAASLLALRTQTIIQNRNATNSQLGGTSPGAGSGLGSGAAAIPTGAIDTTAATELVFSSQKATGTDTLTLEAYTVWLYYKA
jgi:hypothetical protein